MQILVAPVLFRGRLALISLVALLSCAAAWQKLSVALQININNGGFLDSLILEVGLPADERSEILNFQLIK